jgi:glycosyltransferase involved in cell wall biosynthesis
LYDSIRNPEMEMRAGMRIVYVLTSLGVGGAERQTLALAERMARRGHTVALLVLRPRLDEEWPAPLDVFRLEMRRTPFSFLNGLRRGRRFLRDFRPDLVHSHSFHANFVARMLKAFDATFVLVSTIHNVYEGDGKRMMAYRVTDRFCGCTTAVSEAAARRFVKWKAVSKGKCVVVANGIDTEEFAPSTDRRIQMRAQMGAEGRFIWLTAGRVVAAKDYPNLLRAFAAVHAACAETQLWIAGPTDGPEFAKCRELVEESGLRDAVRWLGLRRDMPALLDAADAFVLGSAWEGMPLALGEAMAMEKPVVATDVGGVRELVGDAGIVVPAGNSDALAEAMKDLMQRAPDDLHVLGRLLRERILKNFGMDAKADEWEALYESLLQKRKGPE